MGKVDYKGYGLHGRTLPVVCEGWDFHGIPMVTVLDPDGMRIGLPADRVQVFDVAAKDGPGREAAE